MSEQNAGAADPIDEFEALLAKGEEANRAANAAVPAGTTPNNVLPGDANKKAAGAVDLATVKRALTTEFDQGTVNRAFAPLLEVVERQDKLVTGLQQELSRRDSVAYEQSIIAMARKTGDDRYGKEGEPVTPEQYQEINRLHSAAMGALADSAKAAQADKTGKTAALTPEQAIARAQEARMGKSGAVRAVQASVKARHDQRTFTPQSAAQGGGGGSVSPREQGIAAIAAVLGR